MQVLPTFRALVRIFCVGLLSLMFGIVGLGAVLYVSEMRSRVPLCPTEQYEAALAAMPNGVDWSEMVNYEKEDKTVGTQTFSCTGDKCEIVDLTT